LNAASQNPHHFNSQKQNLDEDEIGMEKALDFRLKSRARTIFNRLEIGFFFDQMKRS